MKNLEQIRAATAAVFWNDHRHRDWRGEFGESVVRITVCRIYQQGLLSAIAAAKDKSTTGHPGAEELLMLEIGRFLASREHGLLAFAVNTADDFLRGLAGSPSLLLHEATDEALSYLGYLKRLHPH